MSPRVRTVFVSAAAFFTMQACAVREVPIVATHRAPVECEGGQVRSESEAASYGACNVIRGNLEVVDSSLSSLAPFANVRRISGSLILRDNARLESVLELGQLRSVRSVEITGNPELGSLAGLERIARLERLVLERNGLFDTRGLESLSEVGELVVSRHPKLISMGGLRALRRAHSVEIAENPRLCARLGLLPALRDVSGDLRVNGNLGLSENDVSTLTTRARPSLSLATNATKG